jgi:nucleoside-diphosphate-sugar epimerase
MKSIEILIAHSRDEIRENDRPYLEANVDEIQSELNWEPKIEADEGIKNLIRLEIDE